jgi:hypothetical protein
MRRIKAIKIAKQDMLEVTREELKEIMELNPWVSLGQFDIENYVDGEGVIGYVAGDIGALRMPGEESKITDSSVHDCWFINWDFFEKNYQEVE